MLHSLAPQLSSRMPCMTVSSACVHGRAPVRACFVQATSAERRSTKTMKKQAARRHGSSSGSNARLSGLPIVAAGSSDAVAIDTNSRDVWSRMRSMHDSLIQRTSPGGCVRLPLLQRTLTTSLDMMLYLALKAFGMADAADTERMMQLDPRWLGHPKYAELHDLAGRNGGKLNNKQVRRWLRKHPQHLKKLGLNLYSFRQHDLDHILALGAKDPDNTDRSDHPMNLFIMPSELNSSYGCRISLAKCQYVGLRVWCAVLCWHVLRGMDGMQLLEAMKLAHDMKLAHHMAASPTDLLERVGALAAIA